MTDVGLIGLRICVAKVAQIMGVETEELPVLGKDWLELEEMAAEKERGWCRLALLLGDRYQAEARRTVCAERLEALTRTTND